MAKKAKKEKPKKGKKREKREKREKKEKKPKFAYDSAVSTLGGLACIYAVFLVAAIVFSVVYGILFAT